MTQVTNYHMQTCMDAWLKCEDLLINLFQKKISFSQKTTQVLDECAHICFGTLEALKNGIRNIGEVAILCVGICEECAEVCERYNDNEFKNCASTCRECSAAFSQLASSAI